MIKRRLIRILTVYSKTSYFSDRGTQRGLTYESFQLFEEDLNKKLKNKNVRVHVAIVPVAIDDLIPALLEGRGDVVAAGKLITEWRREQVYGIPPEQVVGSSTKAKFEPRDGKPVLVHGVRGPICCWMRSYSSPFPHIHTSAKSFSFHAARRCGSAQPELC